MVNIEEIKKFQEVAVDMYSKGIIGATDVVHLNDETFREILRKYPDHVVTASRNGAGIELHATIDDVHIFCLLL